jgi:hypothetical protein
MNRQDFVQSLLGKQIIAVYQYDDHVDYVFSGNNTVRLYGNTTVNSKGLKFKRASWVDNSDSSKSILHFEKCDLGIEFVSDINIPSTIGGEFYISDNGVVILS